MTSETDPPRCSFPVAVDRTRLLLGSYRKGDASDPDVYTSAVAAVLAEYPEDIVRRVTDPRGGLPGTCQWLPTVQEVRSSCEREMQPERDRIRREVERARTDVICGRGPVEGSAERRKQVADKIRAKLSGLWTDASSSKMLDPRSLSGQAKVEALARVAEQERAISADIKSNPPVFSDYLRRQIAERTR